MKKGSKSKRGDKTSFVLSQPASMSDGDVVEAAKKEGIDLNKKKVYRIRWNAATKSKASKKKAAKKKAAKKKFTPKKITIVKDPSELDDLLANGARPKHKPEARKVVSETYMSALQSMIRVTVQEEVRRALSAAAES